MDGRACGVYFRNVLHSSFKLAQVKDEEWKAGIAKVIAVNRRHCRFGARRHSPVCPEKTGRAGNEEGW